MKKIILVIMLLFTCSLFAETYTVKSIKGSNGSNGFANIKGVGAITIGQELDDNDYIIIKFGNVVYLDNNKCIKKSGYVKDVVELRKISKSTIIKATDIAPDGPARKGVATAASRASEAKEDFDWDE